MDARLWRGLLCLAALLSLGASYRTQNFIVQASSPELARELGDTAEALRANVALEWLGAELPPWSDPCPVHAQVAPHLGAGGATSFMFARKRPYGWTMSVQGSRERVLDSVLPHEITHTIFATHFGQPLPRWADEGACTTVEHGSEKQKQERLLYQFLHTNRGIPFNQLFAMRDYPSDILPLYAQGFSLARYLIAQGGKRKFIAFVGDGLDGQNWTAATHRHYGYTSLSDLQVRWLEWVRQGMPELQQPGENGNVLAAAQPVEPAPAVSFDNGRMPSAESLLSSVERAHASAAQAAASPTPAPMSFPPLRNLNPIPPSNTVATSDAEYGRSGGWYARQRDTARPISGGVAAVNVVPPSAVSPSQTLSRPQPPEQPRQIILEWSRGQVPAPIAPSGIPAAASPVYPAPAPGTMWR